MIQNFFIISDLLCKMS